jgi:hypothetical protein
MEQRRVRVVGGRNERCRRELRQGLGEAAVADQAELGENLIEAAAGLGCDTTRAVIGAPVDCAAVDEGRAELRKQVCGVLGAERSYRLEGHDGVIPGGAIGAAHARSIPNGECLSERKYTERTCSTR